MKKDVKKSENKKSKTISKLETFEITRFENTHAVLGGGTSDTIIPTAPQK